MTADTGILTCRASNPAGVAECSAELYVEGKSGRGLIIRKIFSWRFLGEILPTCYKSMSMVQFVILHKLRLDRTLCCQFKTNSYVLN